MTLVVKLGSSIVAADDGELRTDVLDAVCEQVATLEQGGERVVMVTSGAIARGMRLVGLPVRPRAGAAARRRPPPRRAPGAPARPARGRWTSCRPPPRSGRATSSAPTSSGSQR